jgi:hypothetical protein
MNRTGRLFAQQQREQAAKTKAEETDWYKAGWNAGFDFGFDAGVQAILKQLTDEGVIDADEPADKSGEVDQ